MRASGVLPRRSKHRSRIGGTIVGDVSSKGPEALGEAERKGTKANEASEMYEDVARERGGRGHRPTYAGCRRACVQLLYRPLGLGRWVTRFARCARLVHTRQPMGIDLWTERAPLGSPLPVPLSRPFLAPERRRRAAQRRLAAKQAGPRASI